MKTKHIEAKLPKCDGYLVPEGYFEDFAQRMEELLPVRPQMPEAAQRTMWQRIRPYVYMAAMFAGIWCMLKMFTIMSRQRHTPLENNPIIAEAFEDEEFVNTYIFGEMSQWDLYDEIFDEGISPDSLYDYYIQEDYE